MRIALIVFNSVGKGTYRRAFQFGRHLALRGHSVDLIATSNARRIGSVIRIDSGVTIVEAPDLLPGALRSGWDLWNTVNRIGWLRKQAYDIVHAFEARPTVIFPAIYLNSFRRVPLIMDWADWLGRGGSVEERPNRLVRALVRPVETFFERAFRTRADGTTVICSTLQQKALELGVPAESIVTLPNGCDVEHLYPIDAAQARRQVGLAVEGPVIGYVGSIFRRDAEFMARSFDLVAERLPGVRLLIIGYCNIDIRGLLKARDAVVQTGPVPESALNNYLAASDIFWLPLSLTQANCGRWPLKLNDYMAVGRPTVATAVGDVTALMESETIGLLSSDDASDFAAQTLRLIRDAPLRVEMGTQARHVAEVRFDWALLTQQLETLYLHTHCRYGGSN